MTYNLNFFNNKKFFLFACKLNKKSYGKEFGNC